MSDIFKGLDTSDRIRGILSSRGKDQVDLAKLLKMTPVTITARMKANQWKVEELKKIAAEYGVLITDLV
jgi:hypothetical protein